MLKAYSLLVLLSLACATRAVATDSPPVKIDEAWMRAVPPSLTDSAAFMKIENLGNTPLRLTGGSSPVASMSMPMETTKKLAQGVVMLGMKSVDSIEIPPHSVLALKPGGDHLMLLNLKRHPREGDTVPVTLIFDPGHQSVTVQMKVRLNE